MWLKFFCIKILVFNVLLVNSFPSQRNKNVREDSQDAQKDSWQFGNSKKENTEIGSWQDYHCDGSLIEFCQDFIENKSEGSETWQNTYLKNGQEEIGQKSIEEGQKGFGNLEQWQQNQQTQKDVAITTEIYLGTGRKLISKYKNLRKTLKQSKKYSKLSSKEIDAVIARRMGVDPRLLSEWKAKNNCLTKSSYTTEEKANKMREYIAWREKDPELFDYEIAGLIGIGDRTLRTWKKEFGIKRKETPNFIANSQKTCSKLTGHEIVKAIKERLGIDPLVIMEWKAKTDGVYKRHSSDEKANKMAEYHAWKKEYPKLFDYEIAGLIGVPARILSTWKCEEKVKNKMLKMEKLIQMLQAEKNE